MLNVTDVADAREAALSRRGSPRITAKDRTLLLKMLEGDELATVFKQIVAEDFGLAAALEMFGEGLAHDARDRGPESLGPEIV